MDKIKLTVQERTDLGKKVKRLRASGIIPANLFGKEIKSEALQVDKKEFQKTFRQVGETGLVELAVGSKTHPVLVHRVQRDPKSDSVIHIDFHEVNLKEKIVTNVPVVLAGESPAEKSGVGLILQTLNEVEVECLPADIPHNFEVSVDKLEEVGQAIHVKDLKADKEKVAIQNDPEEVIVSVQTAEMKEEVEEEVVSPEAVEAIAEKGEGEEGEAAEGGEEKATESTEETPKE
ncbi:MAG: 50S ribosomal protein L25 [bacterium]|nr:50S ribosomal protein L25 [bacterium]